MENNRTFSLIWAGIFFLPALFWLFGCYVKLIATKKKNVVAVVISVGNLEAGGTGKTPLTIEVGKFFKNIVQELYIVAYARDKKNVDEPILISKTLPGTTVIYCRSRKHALNDACNEKNRLIIVDDGFQYFGIKNKIDILVIDPETPMNLLIPAGRMRFPITFVKYADAIVINKTCVNDFRYKKLIRAIKKFCKPTFTMMYRPTHLVNINEEKISLEKVKRKKVLVMCGIAKPKKFINMVKDLNPESIYYALYPDHFEYKRKDIIEIEQIFYGKKLDMVLTTEKDFVKLKNFELTLPVYAVSVSVEIEPYENFKLWLSQKFKEVLCENFSFSYK